MKIKWYGHSAFLITTENGTRIILDPYQSGAFGGALAYARLMRPPILSCRATIMTITTMWGILRESSR